MVTDQSLPACYRVSAVNGAEIGIGSAVMGPDGGIPIGKIGKVILYPQTAQLTHLLIRRLGSLRHDVVAPLSAVRGVLGVIVQLSLPVEQLNRMAAFSPRCYIAPPGTWEVKHGYQAGQVLLPWGRAARSRSRILSIARTTIARRRPARSAASAGYGPRYQAAD